MSIVIAALLWGVVIPLCSWSERQRQEPDGIWLLLTAAVWFTGLGFFLAWFIA